MNPALILHLDVSAISSRVCRLVIAKVIRKADLLDWGMADSEPVPDTLEAMLPSQFSAHLMIM